MDQRAVTPLIPAHTEPPHHIVKRGGKDAQSIRDTLATTKSFVGVTGSVEFDKSNQNTKMDTIHYMQTKPDLSWNALKWN